MKLSFVIPAFNEEAYIGRCLNSIERATEEKKFDVEVIVVDNASTDRTAEMTATFSGVQVIREPMKGITAARRAGYLASTGDLIANVDADTMVTPHWLETVFAAFEKDSKLIALSGPFILYDAPRYYAKLVYIFYGLAYIGYFVNRFILRVGSMLQGGNFVIRRSAIEAIGGYDVRFSFYGEDADMARRLHAIGPVRFTFALPIYASARRLMQEGLVKMAAKYGANYFWTIFLKRPFSTSHVDIRNVAPIHKRMRADARVVAISVVGTILLGAVGFAAAHPIIVRYQAHEQQERILKHMLRRDQGQPRMR